MITLQEVLKKSTDYLAQKEVPNARRQAEEIISYCLKRPRIDLYIYFDQPIQEEELLKIRKNLSRRAKREPLQYIEGEVEFYSAKFKVGPSVLIPRQETELLVDQIASILKQEPLEGKILWDLGTGSGCIGISLKKMFPELRVILSDLSEKALQQAKENAVFNDVEVECYLGDLFEAFEGQVDYLVSNPPYVSEAEYQELEPEVNCYEPKMSFVPGPTGLEIYERLEKDLIKILKKPGKAWFEIGSQQKEALQKIFEQSKNFKIQFEKDYAGHNRFFLLELE